MYKQADCQWSNLALHESERYKQGPSSYQMLPRQQDVLYNWREMRVNEFFFLLNPTGASDP